MIKLTKNEQCIYDKLSANRGTTVSPWALVAEMPLRGGRSGMNESNLAAVHVRNLRKKMTPADGRIETVRGLGYKLV